MCHSAHLPLIHIQAYVTTPYYVLACMYLYVTPSPDLYVPTYTPSLHAKVCDKQGTAGLRSRQMCATLMWSLCAVSVGLGPFNPITSPPLFPMPLWCGASVQSPWVCVHSNPSHLPLCSQCHSDVEHVCSFCRFVSIPSHHILPSVPHVIIYTVIPGSTIMSLFKHLKAPLSLYRVLFRLGSTECWRGNYIWPTI